MIAVLAAVVVFVGCLAVRRRRIDVDRFLTTVPAPRHRRRRPRRLGTGETLGAVAGIVAAGGLDAAPLPLALLGAAAGTIGRRAASVTRRRARARRLRLELPTVADTLALHVLAGDTVTGALHRFSAQAAGVAADEIGDALASRGDGLDNALRRAAETSACPDAGRLYDLLAHAHRAGGPLADALLALARDYRAATAAALSAEGGRRSLAVYGPILALMVPVTLVFLMYPTLAGLSALSSP